MESSLFHNSPTAGPAFSSSRVLRFADLSSEEQEAFVKFFAEQHVQFFKDADGSYVANVRMYDPSVIDMSASQRAKQASDRKIASARRPDDSINKLVSDINSSGSAIDYSAYARFVSLVSPRDSLKPKARPLAWLMKQVEEMYDQRYAKDTADLRDEAEGEGESGAPPSSPFPSFVMEFFSKRYGLRSLVDQNSWDLLYNTHMLRKDHMEVETFARFLEEYYDADDLLFFLYVRSVIQKELNVSLRTRWSELGRGVAQAVASGAVEGLAAGTPAPVFLTFRECQLVSRVVFGSESDPLYRTFISMIERHLTGTRKGKSDSRRIEVTQFLHLALVEYHETRPADESELASSYLESKSNLSGLGGSDGAADALFRDAEAAYEQRLGGGGSGSGSGSGSSPTGAGDGSHTHSQAAAVGKASPKFFDDLGEGMHAANERYLDRVLASAATLPPEVRAQIRAEVQSQLESKLDSILSTTIKSAQSGSAIGVPAKDALVSHFHDVLAQAAADPPGGHAQVAAFCDAVLRQQEVSDTVTPLVSLLVTYATSRLQSAGGSS